MKIPGSKIAVDTSFSIHFLNKKKDAVDVFWQAEEVFLPFVVKGELLYGALHSSKPEENLESLRNLFKACQTISSDEQVEKEYANIKLRLRRKGRPIPDNDIWVAACAKAHGLPLACHDAHFAAIEDLNLLSL